MTTVKTQPSEKCQLILGALKNAVTNTLEKKHKLGQYAVMWEDDKLVYKGEDKPQMDENIR